MDEERTEETQEVREDDRGEALNEHQEAYRQQDWDASNLERREEPPEGQEKEYEWHQGQRPRPEGSQDAIEFIDVHKAFGRNTILNGLNLGLPDNQISMILGPSGTGKSVCIKHMVGLLYPDE